jgi:hypothetical protein
MAKLTLQDVLSWFNAGPAISANNTLIEAAIENTLSRDGTSPNDMGADLDMGGHRVINLATPVEDNDAARLIDLREVSEITEIPWDNVTDKPAIIESIVAGTAGLALEIPIVTDSTAALSATTANSGNYTRFSHALPTYTFSGTAGLVAGKEYHGRYIGAGTLTIAGTNGMTVNAPYQGTLVIPPQGTFTVKIVSSTVADLLGATVAA